QREILFQPRLTLYINKPEWAGAFQSPRYVVTLGRSQDLWAYTNVRVMALEPRQNAYFEHTLIPFEHPFKPPQGVVLQMPRFLEYANKRRPAFGRYVMLKQRVMSDDERMLSFGAPPESFWVDPETPEVDGRQLGLIFHSFV
ncbi:MAG TPA: hypothetical protein PLJ62_12740, partial [Thermoflexales bacterium]|nr:hypothetical protein [Thermoflexales bacterium]